MTRHSNQPAYTTSLKTLYRQKLHNIDFPLDWTFASILKAATMCSIKIHFFF